MKVKLEKIGDEGLVLDQKVEPDWLQEALGTKSPFTVSAPIGLNLQLFRAEKVVHLKGCVRVSFQTACGRCLAEVNETLKANLEMALFPAGSVPDAGSDGEIEEADMGVAIYEGQEIDLADIVRDEVFLQLPMTPLCRKSCAGLCDSCGANLNDGECDCPKPIDLRWSALKDVKLN